MSEVTALLGPLESRVAARLKWLDAERVVERIWEKDPSVWGGDATTPELADRLGWLELAERSANELGTYQGFADEVAGEFRHVVLCGMGGSSLAPDVLARAFGQKAERPTFTMLDSTHPDAIAAVDRACTPSRTLYLIASKSGSTIETSSFFRHYWEVTSGRGAQFVAITDPGSPLDTLAAERGFRRTFLAPPDVGGRYSALSAFGLVPGALAGVDVARVLNRGAAMAVACRERGASRNPGAWLGAILAEAQAARRDKLTLVESGQTGRFGLWVEQLVAESTGKQGYGLIPVVSEPPGDPAHYGSDRLFVHVTVAGWPHSGLVPLAEAGHPVFSICLGGPEDLGAEFFRWEFATAMACGILGVNAFDQPNVAESKANTTAMLRGGVRQGAPARASDVAQLLKGARPGEYVALLAYLPDSPETTTRLSRLAARWRDAFRVAVTPGLGPRYLHSTGQLHKGGPTCGRFVFVVPPLERDVPIPGQSYTFGALMAAQAEGDIAALSARGRAVVRVGALETLEQVEGP